MVIEPSTTFDCFTKMMSFNVSSNFNPVLGQNQAFNLTSLNFSILASSPGSQRTLAELIIGSFVLCVIIILTVFGNIMVILSIFTYQPLRKVQNFFLVSLASADMAVASLVMPFNVVRFVTGRWIFGRVFCYVWLTCDILLCTASILNLCAIAIDRYWAIHDPVGYANRRTKRLVLTMIGLVWGTSTVISIPPLLGWNDWTSGSSQSFARRGADDLGRRLTPPVMAAQHTCSYTTELSFVIYSAIGSFYLPLAVMAVVYVQIYRTARARLRQRTATIRMTRKRIERSQPREGGGGEPSKLRKASRRQSAMGAERRQLSRIADNASEKQLMGGEQSTIPEEGSVLTDEHVSVKALDSDNVDCSDEIHTSASDSGNKDGTSGNKDHSGEVVDSVGGDNCSVENAMKPTECSSQRRQKYDVYETQNTKEIVDRQIEGRIEIKVNVSDDDDDDDDDDITWTTNVSECVKHNQNYMGSCSDNDANNNNNSASNNIAKIANPSQNGPVRSKKSVVFYIAPDTSSPEPESQNMNQNITSGPVEISTEVQSQSAVANDLDQIAIISSSPQLAANQCRTQTLSNQDRTLCEPTGSNASVSLHSANWRKPALLTRWYWRHPFKIIPSPEQVRNRDNERSTATTTTTTTATTSIIPASAQTEPEKPSKKGRVWALFTRGRTTVGSGRLSVSSGAACRRPSSKLDKSLSGYFKEKEKISITKEKKAAKTLAIIMSVFVLCWLPFFILYVLAPLCGSTCRIHEKIFEATNWLGYINSAMNPIIYTIFNMEFRVAFSQIFAKVACKDNY